MKHSNQAKICLFPIVYFIFVFLFANHFLLYFKINSSEIEGGDMIHFYRYNNNDKEDENNNNFQETDSLQFKIASNIDKMEKNDVNLDEIEKYDINIKNVFTLPTRILSKKRSGVAICALVKDEEAYLEEWIDYHLGIGIEHIFIFDNSDDYDLKDWQKNKKYIHDRVSISHYPGHSTQMTIYNNCVKHKTLGKYHWTAFLDVDEFLILKKHENIVDLLQEHCQTGSLQINWYIFGPNQQSVYEPLPVTKRFQYRNTEPHHATKIIVRNEDFVKMKNPHSARLKNGTFQHDTHGNFMHVFTGTRTGASNPNKPMDVVALHHYRYKSRREFWYRRCMRKAINLSKWQCYEDLSKLDNVSQTFDDSAWTLLKRHVPKYGIFDQWQNS